MSSTTAHMTTTVPLAKTCICAWICIRYYYFSHDTLKQDKCKGNHPPETNYTMRQSDNTILDIRYEMTERDLGVAIDNHLNFKLHISQTVSQANRLLRRSFEYLDQKTFLYLYNFRLNSTQPGIRKRLKKLNLTTLSCRRARGDIYAGDI